MSEMNQILWLYLVLALVDSGILMFDKTIKIVYFESLQLMFDSYPKNASKNITNLKRKNMYVFSI